VPSLRRISDDPPSPTLPAADRVAFARTVALLPAPALTDASREAVLRLVDAGRRRLAALSGVLVGGQALAGRAVVVDAPVGKGHVVMFANRPYWRWQTQGNFFLGFNTILNWNDLDAGRRPATTTTTQQR